MQRQPGSLCLFFEIPTQLIIIIITLGTGPPAQSFALICKLIRIALLAVNINDVSSIIPGISNGSPLPPMMLFLLRDYFLLLKKP